MSLHYARYRLKEWSKYGKDNPQGYPGAWSVASAGSRPSKDPLSAMPMHIALVDVIVRQMEPEPRKYLIVHYCQTGSGREKALRMGVPKTTYFRWVDAAEWHVHIELEYSDYLLLQPGTVTARFAVS